MAARLILELDAQLKIARQPQAVRIAFLFDAFVRQNADR
jgi:hypothetical protein